MKFADTSWWVAWALPGEARHDDALAMLGTLGKALAFDQDFAAAGFIKVPGERRP